MQDLTKKEERKMRSETELTMSFKNKRKPKQTMKLKGTIQ